MKLFSKKDSQGYTVIIGCGRLGANIANELSNNGENVLVIDKNKKSFRRLDSNFGGLTLVADGTELTKLDEAKLNKATTVLVVTDDDNTNIMISQIAKELYNVNRVIARLSDSRCESVYKDLGINIICSAILLENEVEKILENTAE